MGGGEQGGMRVEESPRGGVSLRGSVVALIFILGILWIACHLALRTRGGQDLVKARLERLMGTPLSLDRATLVFPLTLRVEGIQSADYQSGVSGYRVRLLRVRPGWRPHRQLALEGMELNLHPAVGGGWHPLVLSALGDLPAGQVQGLSDLCAAWRERWRLAITGGEIRWFTAEGEVLADVQGLSFLVAPVALPDRQVHVHRLVIERVADGGAGVVTQAELEWLSDATGHYVELTRSPGLPPADGAGFWSVEHGQTAIHD